MSGRAFAMEAPSTTQTVQDARTPFSAIVVRTILTAAGAAALGIGALLEWFRPNSLAGTSMDWHIFFRTTALQNTVDIFRSAGGIMLLLGILALMGLVFRSGMLTRLAGTLALIGFAMYMITLYRANAGIANAIGAGMWVILAASFVTIIGGFYAGIGFARSSATATPVTSRAEPVATGLLATEHECHVVRNPNGGWDVMGPGRARDAATFDSHREAETRARELLAMNGGGTLVVHGRRGKVRGTQTVTAA